ncbi:hypothetical protein COR50_14165 [Chitinophaga caeni]|uniref:Uncharacterized protein n=1 Tax=Chitinophaga caeni TaxID=2029983 RepID=A0A291QW76_9BACT|nr:hypothetical protein [Chitinophaga caeni]ATL48216.1 hypothetical protein COR50_14165 [Chitinophaga caeni]
MKEEKFPRMLSKKEVQSFIESGEAVYDTALSKEKFMEVYKFSDGRVIFKNPDGKGAYWKSLEQVNEIMVKVEKETEVFNMTGWIKSKENLPTIKEKSLQLLKEKAGKILDYSQQSLSAVSKLKIENIAKERELFYAILYYSCEACAAEINGSVDVEPISGTNYYRPVVKDNKGRVYIPYAEFLESFVEKTKITIAQSIDIELDKFKL